MKKKKKSINYGKWGYIFIPVSYTHLGGKYVAEPTELVCDQWACK